MSKETLEEAAENHLQKWRLLNNIHLSNILHAERCKNDFTKGVEWAQERMYSDMQEYAEFCIECDRKQMPLLLVQDWYEHYKKEIV